MIFDTLLEKNLKAVSVCFSSGNEAFALYEKSSSVNLVNEIRKTLLSESKPDIIVEQLDILNFDNKKKYKLFQLFLNACSNSQSDRFSFNNITGRLLVSSHLMANSFKKQRKALEIKVNYDNSINLDVRTLTSLKRYNDFLKGISQKEVKRKKEQLKKIPKYEIIKATGCFKRVFNNEKVKLDEQYVILKPAIDNKKSSIDFFSLNPKAYELTKIGILNNVLINLHNQFGDYLSVNQKFYSSEDVINESFKANQEIVLQNLQDNIFLVNKTNDSEIFEEIFNKLKSLNIQLKKSSKIKSTQPNIQLIHDKEYYQKYYSKDLYQKSTSDTPIQNLTLQQFINYKKTSKTTEPLLFKILNELSIKNNICKKRITLFDWESLGMPYKIHLGYKKVDYIKDEKQETFFFLTIYPDGYLEYNALTPNLFSSELHWKLLEIYKSYNYCKDKIEAVIITDNGDVNLILRTNFQTYPDLKGVNGYVMEGVDVKDFNISKENLLKKIETFINENDEEKINPIKEFKKIIISNPSDNIDGEFLVNEYKKLGKSKIIFEFNKYFKDIFNVWLRHAVKNKEVTEKYYSALVDISIAKTHEGVFYWANKAMKDTQGKFLKSNIIRKIEVVQGEEFSLKLLMKTLNVAFVRINAPTVLPFPVKLLNEYVNNYERPIINDTGDFLNNLKLK
ncbi:MAG: hypothetical protein KQH79_14085 [Bacteroidetes bacterium]|nr:hypothetical protein [Bacteroidota bacterium]